MIANSIRDALPPKLKAWFRHVRRALVDHRGTRPLSGIVAADSFGSLVDAREAWLFATLPPAVAAYQYDIFSKVSQKRLARRLGLSVAEDYVACAPLTEALAYVEQHHLDRFVIKPNSSRSAIGCHPLVRDGEGFFLDVRSGRRFRHDLLAPTLRGELIRGRDDAWIVEELLLPADGSTSVIEDYKLYCFGGKVELIFYKRPLPGDKLGVRHWYTRDWVPVTPGDRHYPPRPFAPIHGARLVEAAETASSQLCYPFIRIDLYDASRGVVLGEFTPGPGRAYCFNEAWNPRLVALWHEAARAIAEGIRAGRITPLGPEPAVHPERDVTPDPDEDQLPDTGTTRPEPAHLA